MCCALQWASALLGHRARLTGRVHWSLTPRRGAEPLLPLTLEAQVLPVVSEQGTIKLGAGQLLVDGLEDSAMHWVLAIQATCPKTYPQSTSVSIMKDKVPLREWFM